MVSVNLIMPRCLIVLFLSLTFCGIQTEGNGDYDAPQQIMLYHTTDLSPNPQWVDHGSIILQNINTGNVLISQPVIDDFVKKRFDEKLASMSDDLFRMKSVVKTSKGKEIPFYSAFKLNALRNAGHISIVASLDQNGSIISIKAYPGIKKLPSVLNTSVSFKAMEQGPVPDTASYILKLEREREAKERGATQDNRSFLAKYWMYLVPVILFAILSGTTNNDPAVAPR